MSSIDENENIHINLSRVEKEDEDAPLMYN